MEMAISGYAGAEDPGLLRMGKGLAIPIEVFQNESVAGWVPGNPEDTNFKIICFNGGGWR